MTNNTTEANKIELKQFRNTNPSLCRYFPKKTEEGKDAITLRGVVGEDFLAIEVAQAIEQVKTETFNLFLRSPGGYVQEGHEILNILEKSGKLGDVYVIDEASSIAVILALASTEQTVRRATSNTKFIVHSAFTTVEGDLNQKHSKAIYDVISEANQHYAEVVLNKSSNQLKAKNILETIFNSDEDRAYRIDTFANDLGVTFYSFAKDEIESIASDEVLAEFQLTEIKQFNTLRGDKRYVDFKNVLEFKQASLNTTTNHGNSALINPNQLTEINTMTTEKATANPKENTKEAKLTWLPLLNMLIGNVRNSNNFVNSLQLKVGKSTVEVSTNIPPIAEAVEEAARARAEEIAEQIEYYPEDMVAEILSNKEALSNLFENHSLRVNQVVKAMREDYEASKAKQKASSSTEATKAPATKAEKFEATETQALADPIPTRKPELYGKDKIQQLLKQSYYTTFNGKERALEFGTNGAVNQEKVTELTRELMRTNPELGAVTNKQNFIKALNTSNFTEYFSAVIPQLFSDISIYSANLDVMCDKVQINSLVTRAQKVFVALEEIYTSGGDLEISEDGTIPELDVKTVTKEISIKHYGQKLRLNKNTQRLLQSANNEFYLIGLMSEYLKTVQRLVFNLKESMNTSILETLYQQVKYNRVHKIENITTIDEDLYNKIHLYYSEITSANGDVINVYPDYIYTGPSNFTKLLVLLTSDSIGGSNSGTVNPVKGFISLDNLISNKTHSQFLNSKFSKVMKLNDSKEDKKLQTAGYVAPTSEDCKRDLFFIPKGAIKLVAGNGGFTPQIDQYEQERDLNIVAEMFYGVHILHPEYIVYIPGKNITA